MFRSHASKRWTPGRFVAGLVAASVLGLALGFGLRSAGVLSGDKPPMAGVLEVPPDDALQTIAQFDDGSHVFALRWLGDDELWYVRSAPAGNPALCRYTLSATVTNCWEWPIPAAQTMYTFLVEDGKGILWAAANYSLVGFDPAAQAYVMSAVLDKRPAELDPIAAKEEPFEGSWITAMARDSDGSVVVARHHVLALYRVSAGSLAIASELNDSPTGLRMVEGRLEAVAPLVESGFRSLATGAELPLKDLGNSGCSLKPAIAGWSLFGADGGLIAPSLFPGAVGDPTAMAEGGHLFVMGLAESSAVLVADCQHDSAHMYGLGSSAVLSDGPFNSPNRDKPIANGDRAESVAVSPGGKVAAGLSSNSLVLFR